MCKSLNLKNKITRFILYGAQNKLALLALMNYLTKKTKCVKVNIIFKHKRTQEKKGDCV